MPELLTFVTPYWSGREMMRIHLESIRRFHPTAPILISKRGGERDEMEALRRSFDVEYWLEDCTYKSAVRRLLARCETEYVCILDHDTVLFRSVEPLLNGIIQDQYDLVGIEERIREPQGVEWKAFAPRVRGWFRFAPGFMDATFLMFNLRAFLRRWHMSGVDWKRSAGTWDLEFHYGICQKLTRHKYLLPYHTSRYGVANVVKDGEVPVLFHQWFGSYGVRAARVAGSNVSPEFEARCDMVTSGQEAFLRDYPNLDLTELTPAWGPEFDIEEEKRLAAEGNPIGVRGVIKRALFRVTGYRRRGMRSLARLTYSEMSRLWSARRHP